MSASHILLGYPWLYDRDVKHSEQDNNYSVLINGKIIKLFPMSPQAIRETHQELNPPKKESLLLIQGDEEREISSSQQLYLLHL